MIDLESAVRLGQDFSSDPTATQRVSWRDGAVLFDGKYTGQSDLQQVVSMFADSADMQSVLQAVAAADAAAAALAGVDAALAGAQSLQD